MSILIENGGNGQKPVPELVVDIEASSTAKRASGSSAIRHRRALLLCAVEHRRASLLLDRHLSVAHGLLPHLAGPPASPRADDQVRRRHTHL